MSTTWALLLLVAARPASFDALKDTAQVLDRPAGAVEALVGDCSQDDPMMQMECQENVKKSRKSYTGKLFYIDLGAGHQDLLQFESIRGAKARFLWVPMYDPGNGIAITGARPRKLTKDGWPILKKKILDGKAPADLMTSDLRRLARLGQVNVELVGNFGKVWQLRNKTKLVRGVTYKIKGLRLSAARTGATLIEVLY